jgi:hypothetical protein
MSLKTKIKTFAAEQPRKMLLVMSGLLLASSLANFAFDVLKPSCPCAQTRKEQERHAAAGVNIADSTKSPAEQALVERARKAKEMITTKKSFSHADSVFIYQPYELLNQYKKKKHG